MLKEFLLSLFIWAVLGFVLFGLMIPLITPKRDVVPVWDSSYGYECICPSGEVCEESPVVLICRNKKSGLHLEYALVRYEM